MKVRSSVKPICEKCKVIKEKEVSVLSVRIEAQTASGLILFTLYTEIFKQ